jgi:hypothetical protein
MERTRMTRYRYDKRRFRNVAVLWIGAWGTLLALIIAVTIFAWFVTESSMRILPVEQTMEERK